MSSPTRLNFERLRPFVSYRISRFATQLGGCTIHNLLSLRADGSTDIEYHPKRKHYLEEIQGIIIDEAMMAEYALGNNFNEGLRQIPLDSGVEHAS